MPDDWRLWPSFLVSQLKRPRCNSGLYQSLHGPNTSLNGNINSLPIASHRWVITPNLLPLPCPDWWPMVALAGGEPQDTIYGILWLQDSRSVRRNHTSLSTFRWYHAHEWLGGRPEGQELDDHEELSSLCWWGSVWPLTCWKKNSFMVIIVILSLWVTIYTYRPDLH